MHHFFAKPEHIDLNQQTIYIEGEDVKHIQKVLRLKVKDMITVSNGSGQGYVGELTSINNKQVLVKIKKELKSIEKDIPSLVLYQGIAKGSKMDFIIQKAVELGVRTIIPTITEHTVVRLKDKEIEKKQLRWQKIAEEAAKQSKSLIMPKVSKPILFKEAISKVGSGSSNYMHLLAYEAERNTSVRDYLQKCCLYDYDGLGIWIGPEGGFHQEEVELAVKSNVHTVTLGPRILRTETSGMVMLSILLYELEL